MRAIPWAHLATIGDGNATLDHRPSHTHRHANIGPPSSAIVGFVAHCHYSREGMTGHGEPLHIDQPPILGVE